MRNDFAIFILSHGRPDRVITYKTLRDDGYTGKIYIVIDNEDSKKKEYIKRFKNVVVFNKARVAASIDEFDNIKDRRTILYARNACFDIAKKLGIRYFMQFDDDYFRIFYCYDSELRFVHDEVRNFDKIINAMLRYYRSIKALSIAMAQTGDFMGGGSKFLKGIYPLRKAMNTFMCSTDRPFNFFGRINEDVNTYTLLGSRGELFFTIPLVGIHQIATQQADSGMVDVYKRYGTYVKSFYTVICHPSSVKLFMMGYTNKRIHHFIKWRNTVPVILRENVKK